MRVCTMQPRKDKYLKKSGLLRQNSNYETEITQLHTACEEGNQEMVQLLLQQGYSVNVVDRWERRPLLCALQAGHESIARLLIECGAEVNVSGFSSNTPLQYACLHGSKDLTLLLIEKGASIDLEDESGRTALHVACNEGHYDICRCLLKNAVPTVRTRADWVESRIAHQKLSTFVNATDVDNRTALLEACERGHVKVVQFLLENSADLDRPDFGGRNPLHVACAEGHVQIVELLLKSGANLHIGDYNQRLPLHWASKSGKVGILQSLIQSGAAVEVLDAMNDTPLHLACDGGHLETAVLLLANGAEVQCVGLQGRTPMHEACVRGYFLLASLLLQHGANIHLRDEFQRTALDLAIKSNREHSSVERLLEVYAREENALPTQLTRQCRKVIRQQLGNSRFRSKIQTLPLPLPIKEYLLFSDMPIWPLYRANAKRYLARTSNQ